LELCFAEHSPAAVPSLLALAPSALWASLTEPTGLLLQLGAALPYLLIIAFSRGRLMAAIALVPLLFGLLVVADPAGLHSCDQKGCDGCSNLLLSSSGS
jgi:hypothetical protein